MHRREHGNLVKITRIVSVLVVLLVSARLSASNAAIQFVAHPDVVDTQLTTSQLKRIFTMRKVSWSDGELLRVFVYTPGADVHQRMCKEVLNMFPYQLDRYWNKLTYSGLGNQPERVESLAEMLTKVRNTPGAVGYILANESAEDLAQIQVVGS